MAAITCEPNIFDNMAVYKGISGYQCYVPYGLITTCYEPREEKVAFTEIEETQDKKAGRDALSEKIACAYQR